MKHGIGRKLLSVVLAVMMLVSLLPTAAFAAESIDNGDESSLNEVVGSADPEKGSEENVIPTDTNLVTVNGIGYATLAEAIANATPDENSVITYEINGKADISGNDQWISFVKDATAVKKVVFIGKSSDAEISITSSQSVLGVQDMDIDVELKDLTLSHPNGAWVNDLGHATNYFSCIVRNAGHTVTYTNCTFPDGACNSQYGKTVFDSCNFTNSTSGKYNLWNYGGDTEIKNSFFTGTRGVKTYNEGTLPAAPTVKIENTSFNSLTEKAAIVASKATDITLTDVSATDCDKGLLQKDIENGSLKTTIEANGTGISGKFDITATTTADAAKNEFNISAGTFTSEVSNDYCADGFEVKANADNTYGVVEAATAAGDGTEANPYTLEQLGAMTRAEYIAAQTRLGGTMYVTVGDYSYGTDGVLGNGVRDDTTGQTPDHSKLNAYGENGYLRDKNDGANGKNIVFVNGSITSGITGYKDIDNIGTSLLLAVPAYTNVTFKGITFNNVMSFNYQLYTSPWSQLGELKFDNCTFNGIIVGAIAAQTLTFNGCEFKNYTNTIYPNSSNPTWIRPAYGNWTKGDNEGQGSDFRSLTTINFTGNTVASTRPVKFERIAQWEMATTVTATGNSFDIKNDGSNKNVGMYFGANAKFDLVLNDTNTKSDNTAALYTAVYSAPDGKSHAGLPAGSTVKDTEGNEFVTDDALEWKTDTKLTLKSVPAETPVAMIGTTSYASLAAAIEAAKDGDTVTLLADATEDVTIDKNITLDLGGKTLTNTNAGKATVTIAKGATATVKNGTVKGGDSYYDIQNNGIATFEGITATGNNVASLVDNFGTLTINSGSYTGGLDTIKNEPGAKLTITGGDFTLKKGTSKGFTGVVFNYGDLTITGGTFTQSDKSAPYGQAQVIHTDKSGSTAPFTKIEGGTFKNLCTRSTAWTVRIVGADYSWIEVSGGTFNKSVSDSYCADGFIPTKNADGTYGVKEGKYVAEISSKKYETLADAIRLAAKGKTITLLDNVTENVEIKANKNLTLDLNGFTLNGGTGTAKAALTNYGTITITDSSADKTGTIKRDDKGIEGEISYYVINNKGTMTIESGTVSNNSGYRKTNPTGSMSGSSLICNGDDDALTPVLNIEGGKFVQENFIAIKNGLLGTLNVSGGEISSKHSAIQNWYKATITGGTINGQLWTDAFVWAEGTSIGETKIGGNAEFNGEIVMDITGTNVIPKLEITDGELNVTKWNITTAAANAGAKPAVSGGTFTSAVPAEYCAAGFIPTKNADNTYGVKPGTYVAEVNGVKYETLQAAIDAAKSGATVKMLANTKENVTISTRKLTLDLNGFTLNGGTEKGKPALTVTARYVTVKDGSTAQTGTIMRDDTAENSGVSSHYVIDVQDGLLTFESGIVKNDSGNTEGKGASLVRVGDDSVAKYPGLTIKGGTFTQDNFIAIKVDRGTLYLNDGEVNSANSYAIENWHNATIKGGTVNGTVAAWTYSGGHNSDLTISGGTVNGDVASVSYDKAEGKLAKVSIKGGTVTGKLGTYTYSNGLVPTEETSKATIEVTGGTFDKDPTKYVVEGSTVNANSDGTFGVEKAYLAKVGDASYYTMDEAFHAAVASGETLYLLRDYTTGAEQNSGSKSFAIDLGGHTWTYTGTNTNCAAFQINYPNVTLTVKNGTVVSNSMVGLIPSAMGGTITYDNAGLVFEGVTMTANGHSGIETNGNNTNDTVTLKNSTLNVPNGFGIYFPSSGTLTIENSTINAKTMGVQVCAGSLNISGDQTAITVTGDAVPKTENDGAIQDGAAISIVNRTGYKGLDKIEVTGGKFKSNGTNAAIKAYDWDNTNKVEKTFTANDKVAVSGGTFTSAVKEEYCAPGYIPTTNSDGTYGVKEGVYVAKVDNVKYETLQAAINAAKGGSTVRLLANVTLTETAVFPAGKKVDLNLVGHNITATGTALRINGTTDIQSTGGVGTIESTGNVAVAVGNNAKLSVFSGTLKGREGAVITGTSTGATIDVRGSKATLIATDNAVIAGNGSKRDGDPNNITIRNGTFIGSITTKGYIACGIYAPWNDNVTVSGGTFNITNGAGIVARAGTVKVTGGTFNCGDGTAKGWVGDSKNNVPNAALVFDRDANYPALTESSQILVSGGTFSTDPAANGATLADGYVATPDESGMYKVAKSNPVAEINGVKYDTLQAAINAAQATQGGATITLLKNINTESYYMVNGDNPVTIDLAGYNITGSGISGLFYVTAKGDLTIKGKGTVTAVEDNGAAMAVWVRSPIAKVTLEGGTYTQQITNTADPHFDLIYVERGNVYVKGGTYKGFTPDWTLNCKDENYPAEAKIEVTGGTFYKFNPADCKTENNGTSTNFVKAGYVSTANTDGTYTVEEYKPVEVWTGYNGTKVASYATIKEAVANLGDNKWIVIGKDYTLTEDFTIGGEGFDNLYLDVAEGATLTVAEGVTLTVAANAKRLGVRDGATLVNKGTIVVCGSSTSNGFAMLYGTFTGNALTVPEGYFLDNNGKNFFATANENAVYEITFGDGTVKKTADSTNIKGGNVKQIKLLKDVTNGGWTLDSSSVGAEVVLDLNGHTLSYNGANRYYATLNVYTKVTIKNGTVEYKGTKRGAIDLVGQGDLTIESDVTINGGDGFAIFTSGTSKLTVNGKVTANGNYAIAGNGSKDAGGYIDSCDITVNDGATISAPKGVAIYHPEKGTVTINGGEISGHTGVQMCSGELIINDGSAITVNGNAVPKTENDGAILDGAAISIINRNYPGGTPKATITGGTFKAIGTGALALKVYDYTNNTVAEWTNAGDYVNVSGGTFSSEIQPAWCAEGFIPHDNGDGTYTVKSQYVAMIGDTKYTTLSEALKDAAKTGGTVLLVADVDDEELVHVRAGVTLNLNGHSITKAALIIVTGQIIDTSDASARGIVSADDYVITPLNGYTPVYDKAKGGYSFFNLWVRSAWESENNKGIFALGRNRSAQDAIECAAAKELLRADLSRVDAVITFSWEDQGTVVTQEFTFQNDKMLGYLGLTNGVLTVVVNGLDQLTGSVKMRAKFVFYKADGAELFTLYGDPVTVK